MFYCRRFICFWALSFWLFLDDTFRFFCSNKFLNHCNVQQCREAQFCFMENYILAWSLSRASVGLLINL